MKNASNPRRGRGRNSGKRNQNSRGSADNDVKVRGSAQQVLDKYLTLARDATSSGDRIAAEGYFQHAEHYQRVLNQEGGKPNNQQSRGRKNDTNKGQYRSRPQKNDTLTNGLSEGSATDEQVADKPEENSDEPLLKRVEVTENPGNGANEDKPINNENGINKATESTA